MTTAHLIMSLVLIGFLACDMFFGRKA